MKYEIFMVGKVFWVVIFNVDDLAVMFESFSDVASATDFGQMMTS